MKPRKDFDEADYDYALNNYNKMLEAIAEADIKVNNYLEKNEVSEHNYEGQILYKTCSLKTLDSGHGGWDLEQ